MIKYKIIFLITRGFAGLAPSEPLAGEVCRDTFIVEREKQSEEGRAEQGKMNSCSVYTEEVGVRMKNFIINDL